MKSTSTKKSTSAKKSTSSKKSTSGYKLKRRKTAKTQDIIWRTIKRRLPQDYQIPDLDFVQVIRKIVQNRIPQENNNPVALKTAPNKKLINQFDQGTPDEQCS